MHFKCGENQGKKFEQNFNELLPMKVKLVAFGIAREILKTKTMEFEFPGSTVRELKDSLIIQFPAFSKLRSLSFAVGEKCQPDHFNLNEDQEVVVIPPVSGG